MELKNAKVLVTGGSSGIGYETAKMLRAHGAQVMICGRDAARLQGAAEELAVHGLVADVSREEDVIRLVAATIERLGGFNVLINNAAFGLMAPLTEMQTADFQRLLATNLTGAMMVARESALHFKAQNYGHIVNVASTAASRGFAGGTAYCASKFALAGMTECWRAELRKFNIRVMQVNPSEVQTDFFRAAGLTQQRSDRKLRGEDIAHAITSILSMDDRGFTTDLTVWATNPD
jgi:3-oxoacyl-[acyl-carrier protein] reductase